MSYFQQSKGDKSLKLKLNHTTCVEVVFISGKEWSPKKYEK
jgi:hypothetical protein